MDGSSSRNTIQFSEFSPREGILTGGSCDPQSVLNSETGLFTANNYTSQVWQTHPIEHFTQRLSDQFTKSHTSSRAVKKFYRRQDAHIRELEKLVHLSSDPGNANAEKIYEENVRKHHRHVASIIVRAIFFLNLSLLICKAAAASISGSLAIISSVMDSCIDLASGGILWYTTRQMRKRRPYTYPQGRTRLEPVAIVVLAVLMASGALQLMIEAVQVIVRMSKGTQKAPDVTNLTLVLMATGVVTKVTLWLVCVKFNYTPAINALLVDQRNDVLTNTASLIFSGLAGRLPQILGDPRLDDLKYMDPSGALIIGFYMLYSWYKLGAEQTRNLAGRTADPGFLQKIGFLSVNHHSAIERLDTIRAFHFGQNFLVEVHIVLPMDMRLKEAHDIGEELQKKLERMERVERAFVHLDYEVSHRPESEHKIA